MYPGFTRNSNFVTSTSKATSSNDNIGHELSEYAGCYHLCLNVLYKKPPNEKNKNYTLIILHVHIYAHFMYKV